MGFPRSLPVCAALGFTTTPAENFANSPSAATNSSFVFMKVRQKPSFGVIYLLTQMDAAARLVVSLRSLRHWYSGTVTLFTTRPESHEIGERCARDARLRVDHVQCAERGETRQQRAYLTKTLLASCLPYRRNVFLDADTVVVDDISELIHAAAGSPLTVTNFMGLSTTQLPFRKNVRPWRKLQDTPGDTFELRKRIDRLLAFPYPAINSGVYAVERNKRFARRWNEISMFAREMTVPDEIGLQLLLFEFRHQILSHEFNYHPAGLRSHVRPRIWHFAGTTHLRTPECRNIWLTAYRECARENVAGIRAWSKVRRTTSRLVAE